MRRHGGVLANLALAGAISLVGLSCSSGGNGGLVTQTSDSKGLFCSLLVAFRASSDGLSADLTSGNSARAESAIKRLVTEIQTLQTRAPADIKPDVDVVATYLVGFDSLFARYDYDLTKLQSDPTGTEAYTTLQSDAVNTASDQLRSYGDIDCGDSPSTTAAPAAASSTSATATTLVP